MNSIRVPLLVILVLGALLRVLYLGKESFWLDEFVTWQCTQDFQKVLTAEPTNPPLYYLLLYPWVSLFGRSEEAFRSFSILPGLAGILLTYLLAGKLFNRRIALIAAAYHAFSSFHVFYSQEARTHAWLVFFLLLSTLTLLKALEQEKKTLLLLVYGVLITLSLYMHYMATFFIAAQGIYVLCRWRVDSRQTSFKTVMGYSAVVGGSLLAFGPWLLQMLQAASGGGQVRRFLFLKPPQAYFSFLFGDTLIPLDEAAVRNVAGTLRENALVLALVLGACITLLPFVWKALRRWWPQALLALVMSTVPLLLCFLVSFKVMVFDERYMQTASLFLYMWVAAAAVEVFEARGGMRLAGMASLVLFVLLGAWSLSNYYFHERYGKEQWREAVPFIEQQSDTRTDLILYDPEYLIACYNYYQKQNLTGWRVFDRVAEDLVAAKPDLVGQLNQKRKIWLIRSHHRGDRVLNALRALFDEKQKKVFPKGKGIEVYEFSPRLKP
jgi:uncharacterized membrane protein